MPHTLDPDSLGFLVNDFARLIRAEFDRRIAATGLGLTPGEGRTLVHLARAGTVRQSVLAERMGVEAMTTSSFIDRLEARGLVERSPDPSDRRAKLLFLTDAADEVLLCLRDVGRAVRDDALADLDEADRTRIQAMLRTARDTLAARRSAALSEGKAA